MTYEEYKAFCAALPAATYVIQSGHHVWKVGGKVFCIGGGSQERPAFSFKASEITFMLLPERPGFHPAPYLASRGLKWIQATAIEVEAQELRELIENSHRLVVAGPSRKKRCELLEKRSDSLRSKGR